MKSASAENRTQKDKDKARQPLGAMFQRAAVLYRVKINFEFTLKRAEVVATPILLYAALFCGVYMESLLQHSACRPSCETHERRLQHHAILKNGYFSVAFLLGAGLFPGGDVQHQRVQRRASLPDALRTVCYRAQMCIRDRFITIPRLLLYELRPQRLFKA